MENNIITAFLPEGLLEQFEIDCIKELGQVKYKRVNWYIFLNEKNILPTGYDPNEYESKGFLMLNIFKTSQFAERQCIWLLGDVVGD